MTRSPGFVDISTTRSRIFVESAFARRSLDLNFQCRTGGMSVHTSLSVTPFGFIASAVAAVILDVTATMAARLNWRAHTTESLRLPLRVVEQTVMARMEASGNRETCGDLNCDPMPEIHAEFREVSPERDVPFRQVVEEECAARLDGAHAFSNPCLTPLQIFFFGLEVIAVLAVFLA